MKKEKMFVPVINETVHGDKVMLISANKIPSLEKFLPCKEALEIHMQMERIETQKDSKYRPKPLCIKIEREKFTQVMADLRRKNTKVDLRCIPLVLQYPAIPICIIEPGD